MPRAKIFLSCGQRSESDEIGIAEKIRSKLEGLGFEVYLAFEQQTLSDLKANIFRALEDSEYFLFIDLVRDQIKVEGETIYRGSLFCNQELALAAYLEKPVIAFQERGVKKLDGVMRFLQTNCQEFADRRMLPSVIAEEVRGKWNPNWKAQLALEVESKPTDATMMVADEIAESRWFHVRVRNLHERKLALNCYAYLKHAKNQVTGEEIPLETVEFKWTATKLPSVMIGPKSSRCFDAICVLHRNPAEPFFFANVYCDSLRYFPSIKGPGTFSLTYEVVSENFPPVSKTLTLNLSRQLDEVHLSDPNQPGAVLDGAVSQCPPNTTGD